MRLVEYIVQNQIKQVDFAKEIGITNVYLGKLLRGQRPSIKLARIIEGVTNGEVTKEDLLFFEE